MNREANRKYMSEQREQLKQNNIIREQIFTELKQKISAGIKLTEQEQIDYYLLNEFYNEPMYV